MLVSRLVPMQRRKQRIGYEPVPDGVVVAEIRPSVTKATRALLAGEVGSKIDAVRLFQLTGSQETAFNLTCVRVVRALWLRIIDYKESRTEGLPELRN